MNANRLLLVGLYNLHSEDYGNVLRNNVGTEMCSNCVYVGVMHMDDPIGGGDAIAYVAPRAYIRILFGDDICKTEIVVGVSNSDVLLNEKIYITNEWIQ